MKTSDKIKSFFVNFLRIFLILSIPFCCSAGISVIPHFLRFPLIIINFLFCLWLMIFSKIKINVTVPSVLFVGAVAFLFISSIFSYSPEETLKYAFVYLALSVLLFIDFSEDFFQKILEVTNIICLIIAVSIVISPIFGDLAKEIINFVTNPLNNPENSQLIAKQFTSFSYPGFAKEVGEAAFIMNIGIATVIIKLINNFKFSKSSVFTIIELIIFIIALALTEKRTLFAVPLIAIFLLLIITKARKKVIASISCFVVAIMGISLVLGIIFEPFGDIWGKFISSFFSFEDNRLMLSDFALQMFFIAPVFGTGFSTFNQLLFDTGTTYNNGMWQSNAHNIYLQSLGETGVVGTILLFSLFVICAVLCIVHLRKKRCSALQKSLLLFALYIHILCFIYGITGNVIYVYSQMCTWILACAISISVSVHLTKCSNKSKLTLCKRVIPKQQ